MAEQLQIQISADVQEALRGINRIESELGGLDQEVGQMQSTFQTAFAGIAGSILGSGISDAIKGVLIDGFSVAGEVSAEAEKQKAILGGMYDSVRAKSREYAKETGVHEEQVMKAMSNTVSMLKAKGLSEQDAQKLAEQRVKAGLDSSAMYNTTLEDSMDRLNALTRGEYDSAEAVGVFMNATMLDAEAQKRRGKKLEDLSTTEQELLKNEILLEQQMKSGTVGQATREADSYQVQLEKVKETFKQLKASFFAPALQTVADMFGKLSGLASDLSGWWEGLSGKTKKMISMVILLSGAFVALAGGIFAVVAPIMAMGAMVGTAFLPMIGIIAGIVAGVMGLVAVGYLLYTNWGKITKGVSSLFSKMGIDLGSVFGSIKSTAQTAWTFIKTNVLEAGKAIVEFAVPIWDKVREAISRMASSAMPIVTKMTSFISQAFTSIKNFIGQVMPTVVQIVQGAWKLISMAITFAVNYILPLVSKVFGSIMKIISSAMNFIAPLIKNSWNFIKTLISSTLTVIKNVIQFALNIIKGNWKGAWDNIKNILQAVWNVIKSAVSTAISAVKLILSGGMNFIKSVWSNAWNIVKAVATTAWNMIKQLFGGFVTNLKNKAVEMKNSIVQKFQELKANAVEKIRTMGADIKKKFSETVSGLIEDAKSLPKKIGDGISSSAKNAVKGVKELGAKIINTFKEKLGINSPSKVFTTMGQYVIDGLKNGLSADNIFKFGMNLFGGLAKGAEKAWDGIKGVFTKGKNALGGGVNQWKGLATQALMMTGQFSQANLERLLYQMKTESGGNPRAINNWDINAKRGTPSKGLMQVIDPTFRAYAMKGFDKDVYDPLSNLLASIRYAVARYGSLGRAYRGVGYAKGGIFSGSKGGSFINLAENHGDEAVLPLSNKSKMAPFAHAVAGFMPNQGGGSERIIVELHVNSPIEIDGKEIARQIAEPVQVEIDRKQQRSRRQRGEK